MKRIITAITSLIITFILGVLVNIGSGFVYHRRVSLCQLARNPAAYQGKLVRIEASGSVLLSRVLQENYLIDIYEAGCDVPKASAIVQLEKNVTLSRETNEFINFQTEEIRSAEVVVEGVFDQRGERSICFGPQFAIKSATLTVKSPVTSQLLPEMPINDSR